RQEIGAPFVELVNQPPGPVVGVLGDLPDERAVVETVDLLHLVVRFRHLEAESTEARDRLVTGRGARRRLEEIVRARPHRGTHAIIGRAHSNSPSGGPEQRARFVVLSRRVWQTLTGRKPKGLTGMAPSPGGSAASAARSPRRVPEDF